MKGIFLSIITIVSINCFSQSRTLLDTIMENHILEFRKSVVGDSIPIFMTFDYNFAKNLKMSNSDYYLTPYINPRKLKSEKNFMVKFIVTTKNRKVILNAINFRIKKINNKHLEFVYMGGDSYDLLTGLIESTNSP